MLDLIADNWHAGLVAFGGFGLVCFGFWAWDYRASKISVRSRRR